MKNIIVKGVNNNSICFQKKDEDLNNQVSYLKSLIYEKSGIPEKCQILLSHGKILKDTLKINEIPNLTSITLLLDLKGGKGGFGSLLRGQAATNRKITNFDASRDLQGRRIRNVNNHKKLIEWLKKKKQEDEQIKHELEEFKKMQKTMNVNFKDPRLSQEFKDKLDKWNDELSRSIKVAIKKKKIAKSQQNENQDGEFKIPSKKVAGNDKNLLDEINKSELFHKKFEDLINEIKSKSLDEETVNPNHDEFDEKSVINKAIPEISNVEEESNIKEINIIDEKKYEEIKLKEINSIEDLINLGSDHLKHELMRLGLKCGGTVQERAKRLFDIKLNPTLLFDQKFIAKKKDSSLFNGKNRKILQV